MNGQGIPSIPGLSLTPSQLSIYGSQLVNSLKLLAQTQASANLLAFDPSLQPPSFLDKRNFQSLESAFIKPPEKKVQQAQTVIKENILNSILHEVDATPSEPQIQPQDEAKEKSMVQDSVTKALANQLQFEMHKIKEINTLMSLNQLHSNNILFQKLSLLNSATKPVMPDPQLTNLSLLQNFAAHKQQELQRPPILLPPKLDHIITSVNTLELDIKKENASTPSQDSEVAPPEAVASEPINVEPPALIEFTKDFPTWDLAKIFSYLNKGKTKDDLVKRVTRERTSKPNYGRIDYEDDIASDRKRMQKKKEERGEMMILNEFRLQLQRIFNTTEIDRQKSFEILVSCKMNMEKAVSRVIKNFSQYEKELLQTNFQPKMQQVEFF